MVLLGGRSRRLGEGEPGEGKSPTIIDTDWADRWRTDRPIAEETEHRHHRRPTKRVTRGSRLRPPKGAKGPHRCKTPFGRTAFTSIDQPALKPLPASSHRAQVALRTSVPVWPGPKIGPPHLGDGHRGRGTADKLGFVVVCGLEFERVLVEVRDDPTAAVLGLDEFSKYFEPVEDRALPLPGGKPLGLEAANEVLNELE